MCGVHLVNMEAVAKVFDMGLGSNTVNLGLGPDFARAGAWAPQAQDAVPEVCGTWPGPLHTLH